MADPFSIKDPTGNMDAVNIGRGPAYFKGPVSVDTEIYLRGVPVSGGAVSGLAPSGDTSGRTDAANIQALLNIAGKSVLQGGLFYVDTMVIAQSDDTLEGAGAGVTTIKMASGSWSSVPQNGPNGGISCLQAASGASNIALRGITFDGNQTGITVLPEWADASECAPLALRGVTKPSVAGCEVINAIGYSLYLFNCTAFQLSNSWVTSGQVDATQGWGTPAGQDGVHVSASQYGSIGDVIVDTGSGTAGDDAFALQAWGTGTDSVVGVSITGCTVTAAAQSGIDLALSGGPITGVTITGNTISNTQADGLTLRPFSYAAGVISSGVTITTNTFENIGLAGTGYNGITAVGYLSESLGTGNGWADLIIATNTFLGFDNPGQLGMLLTEGSGLAVGLNIFDNWNASTCIQIGDSGAPTGVTGFQVGLNTVTMTGTDTGGNGILVQESTDGTLTGNKLTGPGATGAGSAGISIGSGTTACTGIVTSGNRVKGWDYGVSEYNGGVASDYNIFTSNNCYGCTNSVSTTGPHDIVANNLA